MGFNSFRINRVQSNVNATTHEGGPAVAHVSPEHALYNLAAGSLFAGDKFYEPLDEQLVQFTRLTSEVLARPRGAEFIGKLAVYCREDMYLRTMPQMLLATLFTGNEEARKMARRVAPLVWLRGDEHLEALAFVRDVLKAKYSHALRKALRARMQNMTEYQMVKYAKSGRSWTQRDAVRLAHAKPCNDTHSALLKFTSKGWDALTADEQALLHTVAKARGEDASGITWEQIISKKGSTPEAWAEAVEVMPYMACLRNIRNLLDKGAPQSAIDKVCAKLRDPRQVERSRQLPFRFLSALDAVQGRATPQVTDAIIAASELASDNLPSLEGNTLVLVDVSGSMSGHAAKNGQTPLVTASVLGATVAKKCRGMVWAFATTAKPVFIDRSAILAGAGVLRSMANELGGGTEMGGALKAAFERFRAGAFDRVVILSDMQTADDAFAPIEQYRREKNKHLKVYGVNLNGYPTTAVDPYNRLNYNLTGMSDRVLDWILAVEVADPVTKILERQLVLEGEPEGTPYRSAPSEK